jgi:alkylation response protein AidB-like acyl-CoA dehydrogenase
MSSVKLSHDQEEIRAVARSYVGDRYPIDRVREAMAGERGFEDSSWSSLAELGWAGIAVPEAAGGAGYSVAERCLLLEEMGRGLVGEPYLSSAVLAADALLLIAGLEEPLLAEVAAGARRATLVTGVDLLGGVGGIAASEHSSGWQLSGSGGLCLDAASADVLLVVARTAAGELGLFAIERGSVGVDANAAPTIDATRKTATVELAAAPARRLGDSADVSEQLAQVLERAGISLAAESVGAARAVLEMTVDYLNDREQFGGPIGRFQALKHRASDHFLAIESAREMVYAATDAMLDGDPRWVPALAAAAQASASDAFLRIGADSIQLHGAIGFTAEHAVGLFYKRALVSAATLGSSAVQLERIAVELDV